MFEKKKMASIKGIKALRNYFLNSESSKIKILALHLGELQEFY